MRLDGTTLILTGASRGIGRALAIRLARRGVRLVLNARSEDLLAETAAATREIGVRTEYVTGDAATADTCRKLVTTAQDTGGFHGFIHAAGLLHPGPLVHELAERDFDAVMDASVKAAWQLASRAYPLLSETGSGLAVFFGSGASEIAQPGIGAYCVAKAAEEHLMRQLAAEVPAVTALVYRPGIVETRMQEQARQAEGGGAENLHGVFRPWKEQGLLISPEDAADGLLAYLERDHDALHGRVLDVRDL